MINALLKWKIIGILTVIAGGIILILSIVAMVKVFTGSMYKDVHTFRSYLQLSPTESDLAMFTEKEKKKYTVWLNYPGRRIQGRDITVEVQLMKENQLLDRIQQDFNLGYVRDSTRWGEYYKIGEFTMGPHFEGYLRYKTTGLWKPKFNGTIVLRQGSPIVQVTKIGFGVLVGLGMFIYGLVLIPSETAQES